MDERGIPDVVSMLEGYAIEIFPPHDAAAVVGILGGKRSVSVPPASELRTAVDSTSVIRIGYSMLDII